MTGPRFAEELLARVEEAGLSADVVVRPDQWWAVPAAVRVDQA